MKQGTQYKVKGIAGLETYLEILKKRRDGYDILITSVNDDSVKESYEFIGSELFDACVRTGYLTECRVPALKTA